MLAHHRISLRLYEREKNQHKPESVPHPRWATQHFSSQTNSSHCASQSWCSSSFLCLKLISSIMPICNKLWSARLYHCTFITVPAAFSLLKDDLEWQSLSRSKKTDVKEGGKHLVREGVKAGGGKEGRQRRKDYKKKSHGQALSLKNKVYTGEWLLSKCWWWIWEAVLTEESAQLALPKEVWNEPWWSLELQRQNPAKSSKPCCFCEHTVLLISLEMGNQSLNFSWATRSGTSLARDRPRCKFLLHLTWARGGCLGSG